MPDRAASSTRSAKDLETLREISDEIRVLRIDATSDLATVLAHIQSWLELDSLLVYSTRNRFGSWELERWEAVGAVTSTEQAFRAMFSRVPEFPLKYDPITPPPEQRNRLIDALASIDREMWEQHPLYRDVLYPRGLHDWHQERVLVCDGPSLVAWFGAVVERPLEVWQRRMLSALVAPMRERLVAERLLHDGPAMQATLEVALDELGRPAFLVADDGHILHANSAGEDALDADASLASAIRDAAVGRPSSVDVDLREVICRGIPVHAIAILRPNGDARLEACVERCSQRWSLTVRQRQVLDLVTRGMGNATIAAMLGCVERTVELHVTAILDRAGVDNRSALVSRVLTSI